MSSEGPWHERRVVVTGGAGFLGRRVVAELEARGASKIVVPRSAEHDLRNPAACREVVQGADVVFHLAARVGGIGFNVAEPADLFYDNVLMGTLVLEEARQAGVAKFVGLGTICSYPRDTPVPFRENSLWEGYPEESNAPYGLAKKMLLVQGQAYRKQHGYNAIYLIPTNLYGPGDNMDPKSSHVIPALIRKVIEAQEAGRDTVEVWGTGTATRDFLYVDDAARGIVDAAERYNEPEPVNLGSGSEISIRELAELIATLCEFDGQLEWDVSRPDGQPRRMVDAPRAREAFGFAPRTDFRKGLRQTIDWYRAERGEGRG